MVSKCILLLKGKARDQEVQREFCLKKSSFREHHCIGVVYNETVMLSQTFHQFEKQFQHFNYTLVFFTRESLPKRQIESGSLTGEKHHCLSFYL